MAWLIPGMIAHDGAHLRLRLRVEDWPTAQLFLRASPGIAGFNGGCTLSPLVPPRDGTWILDLGGLAPGTTYRLAIEGGDDKASAVVCTPPTTLADGDLLLAVLSCYFPSEEYEGNPGRVLECLRLRAGARPEEAVPHLKVFCGDQIYADVPWAFGESESPAQLFERRYRKARTWNRLGALLAAGANLFLPEDHEYWNSFPDQMLYLSRSASYWHDWGLAGAEAAWTEQGVWNFVPGFRGGDGQHRAWGQGRISGVDLFVADTRTDRVSYDNRRSLTDQNGVHSETAPRTMMGREQREALEAWCAGITELGILVLGQPLLTAPTQPMAYDTTLADYEDYPSVVRAISASIVSRGVTVIVLTGDIHWGRLVFWEPPGRPAGHPYAKLVEFVASPIARVGSVPSLFSRKNGVGEPEKTDLKERVGGDLRRLLGWAKETRVFATNDNNFGLLRLSRSVQGSYQAQFELRSLTTRNLADNRWSGPKSCLTDPMRL